jgi:5-methylcytosine-specific restriction protein A
LGRDPSKGKINKLGAREMPRRVGKKDPTKWSEENHDIAFPRYVKERVVLDACDICGSCGVRVRPGSGHIDHIIPLQDGGAHAFGNLQYLCKLCHGQKTAKENSTRAKGNRVFAKTYGIARPKNWTSRKKPKPKQGRWVGYDLDLDGIPKRLRWVGPDEE